MYRYFVGYVYQPEWSDKPIFGSCHIELEKKFEYVGKEVEEATAKNIRYYGNLNILSCSFICEVKGK